MKHTKQIFYLVLALILLQVAEWKVPALILPLARISPLLVNIAVKPLIILGCMIYIFRQPGWKNDRYARATLALGGSALLLIITFFVGLSYYDL
jgi:ABC-type polysaccharide/polyol phosphate export permease